MSDSKPLNPCPFCGGRVTQEYCPDNHIITCEPCDVMMYGAEWAETKEEQAARWNTRAKPSAPAPIKSPCCSAYIVAAPGAATRLVCATCGAPRETVVTPFTDYEP